MGNEGRKSRRETSKSLEARQRLHEMYELERIGATEYRAKCAEIEEFALEPTRGAAPAGAGAAAHDATLVEDWAR